MKPRIVTLAELQSPTLARVLRERRIDADRAEAAKRLPRTRIERAMVSQLCNHPRMALLCLGEIPDTTGFPQTTIAAHDAEVISL